MKKFKLRYLVILFSILFSLLTYSYYYKTQKIAFENAQNNIHEFLLNYKAFRQYTHNIQKKEVYRLQELGHVDFDYFNPKLLSSSYGASGVNKYYNQNRKNIGQNPIQLRFASNNPRNPNNLANEHESQILKQFNDGHLKYYTEVIKKDNKTFLYYAIPTQRTTASCMRCHSTPEAAPKDLIEQYGNKRGFYEKVGQVRAILSTQYNMEQDLKNANYSFWFLTSITFAILLVVFLGLYLFIRKIQKINFELTKEKNYTQALLDTSPDIIIVTNGKNLLQANQTFFDFFNYEDIKDFQKNHKCICEYFVSIDDNLLDENNKINNINWCLYVTAQPKRSHVVKLQFNNQFYYFQIDGSFLTNKKDVLLTLQDFTELYNKNKLLLQQSKLVSIEEVIHNISHQWKQPLSTISTNSSSLKLLKENNMLSDEKFNQMCDQITFHAQNLSKTIYNFDCMIKDQDQKLLINIKETIENLLSMNDLLISENNIKLILDIDKNIHISSHKNELLEVLIHIFNNVNDALEKQPEEERFLFITVEKSNDDVRLILKDSGGGIDEEILQKIFEPYFTTKHESQGTGLGLFTTYKIINDVLDGTITAENSVYSYDTHQLKGVEFTITLPLDNENEQ